MKLKPLPSLIILVVLIADSSALFSQKKGDDPELELILSTQVLSEPEVQPKHSGYYLHANSKFVDELISHHLRGEITLYRDAGMQIAYPGPSELFAYADTAFGQVSGLRAKGLEPQPQARTRSMASTTQAMSLTEVHSIAGDLLNAPTWGLMMLSREAASMTYQNREDLMSQIKQLWKLRVPLQRMSRLSPWSWESDRVLFFTAEVGAEGQLQFNRAILLLEYIHQLGGEKKKDLGVMVFDPNSPEVPWELLSVSTDMRGIEEGLDPSEVVDQRRAYLEPVGYRVGQDQDFVAFKNYSLSLYDSTSMQTRDSLLQAWQVSFPLSKSEELVSSHPLQTKPYSLYIDAQWFQNPPEMSEWAQDQYKAKSWQKTLDWVKQANDTLLKVWRTGEVAFFTPQGGARSYPDALAYIDAQSQIKRWMKRRVSHVQANDFQVAAFQPEAYWDSLADLSRFDFSWKVDGELTWYQGQVSFRPKWLTLVCQDPSAVLPGIPLTMVDVEEVSDLNLGVEDLGIEEFLSSGEYTSYPLSVNHESFYCLDQAVLVSKILEKGAWDMLPTWLVKGAWPSQAGSQFWEENWLAIKKSLKKSAY